MKKILFLFILPFLFFVSCKQRDSSTTRSDGMTVRVTETDHQFRFKAKFRKSKTEMIQHYISTKLGNQNLFSDFKCNQEVLLADETKFYLNARLGYVEISLDKDENTEQSLEKLKRIGNSIKEKLLVE
jgi:hypothetical protein